MIWPTITGLGTDDARVVAEMVDGQRQVSRQALADALAIVPGFGGGQHFQVFFDAVGDFQQDAAALGYRGPGPGRRRLVRGVKGQVDVRGLGARHLAEVGAVHRRGIGEVLAANRGGPLSTDVILVAFLEFGFRESHGFVLQ
jgi:hypothetical protein